MRTPSTASRTNNFFISQPQGPVGEGNDPAIVKTVLCSYPLHRKVFPMGVDANTRIIPLRTHPFGLLNDPPGYILPFQLRTNGYAMDHGIRQVRQPCPVDMRIRRLAIERDHRRRNDRGRSIRLRRLLQDHITVSPANIVADDIRIGIAVLPLLDALLTEIALGFRNKRHDGRNILFCGVT